MSLSNAKNNQTCSQQNKCKTASNYVKFSHQLLNISHYMCNQLHFGRFLLSGKSIFDQQYYLKKTRDMFCLQNCVKVVFLIFIFWQTIKFNSGNYENKNKILKSLQQFFRNKILFLSIICIRYHQRFQVFRTFQRCLFERNIDFFCL